MSRHLLLSILLTACGGAVDTDATSSPAHDVVSSAGAPSSPIASAGAGGQGGAAPACDLLRGYQCRGDDRDVTDCHGFVGLIWLCCTDGVCTHEYIPAEDP